MGEMHVVITKTISGAMYDWRDKLKSIVSARSRGLDKNGRTILFMHVERPDKLDGLMIDSFEIHGSAVNHRSIHRAISAARMAKNRRDQWLL